LSKPFCTKNPEINLPKVLLKLSVGCNIGPQNPRLDERK
jgi:hypothetical protein